MIIVVVDTVTSFKKLKIAVLLARFLILVTKFNQVSQKGIEIAQNDAQWCRSK